MPGPQTIWTGVEEVPRGCFAILDQEHPLPEFKRFWSVGSSLRDGEPISAADADRLIAESVKLHLIADVPKVVFLSGGVDSTAVAAAAAAQTTELHTLSVAFDDDAADERRFAAAAAEAIGSRHHVVELSASSVLTHLEDAVLALDQPSFDGVNSWFVSREAARLGFKVALSGAGGDELAGGYTSFRRALAAESAMRVPGSRLAARIAGQVLRPLRPSSKLGQLGAAFGQLEAMYQTQYALFSISDLRQMLEGSEVSPLGLSEERSAELAKDITGTSVLKGVTALESEMFLGDRLLRDMDSVSMAHSIELRVPFVDTCLSDALAGLSDEDRYLPIGQKQLLRRQSRRVLPDSFFSRPKRGFEFPMNVWMRGPLRGLIEGRLLDGEQCAAIGLRPDAVRSLWKRFLDRPGSIYWTRPWAIFSLLHWASANGVRCYSS
jgi:asparagine synthase (glutamine-hydrolysing)